MKPNYYWSKSSSSLIVHTLDDSWPYIIKIEEVKGNKCTCIIYEYEKKEPVSLSFPNYVRWSIGPDFPLAKVFTTGQISERIRLGVLKPMTQNEIASALLRMI